MAITVTPLHPHIGAEIHGVDLARPVPPDDLAAIDAAFARHAVLVFPGQKLSDEQQIAFSRHFGPLEMSPDYAGSKKTRLARREISDISNLDPEWTGHVGRRQAAAVQSRQPALAYRQLVQIRAGALLTAVGARDSARGRRDGIRRSAGRL